MAQFSTVDHMHVLIKDWRISGLAKALATLARVSGGGVTSVDNERNFRLNKEKILRGHSDVKAEPQLELTPAS